MSLFDIHFKKPQNVVVVTKQKTFVAYFASPKPLVIDGRTLAPEFTGVIHGAQKEFGNLDDYQFMSGIYNRKNQSFDIYYIAFVMMKDGRHVIGIKDVAVNLHAEGSKADYLSFTGMSPENLKLIPKIEVNWNEWK